MRVEIMAVREGSAGPSHRTVEKEDLEREVLFHHGLGSKVHIRVEGATAWQPVN